MKTLRRFGFAPVALTLALANGCSTFPRAATAPLVSSSPSADVDALVDALYGGSFALPELTARANDVIARHPGDARAHEVAALVAMLTGDTEKSARHFLAAAADLRADATDLYLWEAGYDHTNREMESMRGLLEQLRQRHPDPNVRALAAYRLAWIADRDGRLDEAEQLLKPLGFISQWALLGALDNDQGKGFLTAHAPEKGIDPGAEVAGPLVPLHWRTVGTTRMGSVPLADLLWPSEFALAYAATWVHSDRQQEAQLRLSSSDAARAWCNDGLVLSEELVSGGELDNLIVPVTLHAGWNKILIKSANRRGAWWLRARLTDAHGDNLAGLTYGTTPQAYQPGPSRYDPAALPPPDTASGPENRKRLLRSLRLTRAGQARPALAALQGFLADAPKNVLAAYLGALSLWDNDEQGKAIDLLNQGVAATTGSGGAFLIKRARYYNQKQLFEKAQTDLQAAVALGPWSRWAQLELASLYAQRGWHVDRCQILATVLQRWPDYANATRAFGACRDALGYDSEADRLYARAIKLAPGEADSWERRLDLAWRRRDFGAVRRDLTALRRLDPLGPHLILEEGDLARRTGDAARARDRYELAARLAPEWPNPRERLAALAYETGHRDEALAAWKLAHRLDPNDAQLAQRIEFLEPTRLGLLEKFIPDDAAIERAIGSSPKKHPASHSALLLDNEVTEVHNDGSSRRVITQVAVAYNDQGRDALMHERLPTIGALKILRAYSISEHGERQEASSIRGGQVRFRSLQVGSKVVLQYVLYMPAAPFLPGSFVSSWSFQGVNRQHEDSRWVVLVPKARKLHVQITGAVEQSESAADDYRVYTFEAKNVAPFVEEPHMAPPFDLIAQVDVSTVDGWDDYVRWERALLSDAFRTNPKLDELTDSLVAGAKSPRDKLDRLFHYVAQDVRYQQDYENSIAGVRPHAASAVIERGYGDCKDKAVLLMQMGRRVGLQMRFAILRTTPAGRVRRDVPNQQFNHAIVYVPVQPGIEQAFFMDPTAEGLDMGNVSPTDQGALSLVMDPESGRYEFIEIPYQGPDLQFDRHKIRIDVKSPTEAFATDDIALRGIFAAAVRHILRNEGMAKKMYESFSSMLFPGTTLRNAKSEPKEDTWKPVTLQLDVDVSGSLQQQDENWRLKLPGQFELQPTMGLKKRETPLRLGAPSSSSYDIEALLPDGYHIVHAPKDFTVEQSCFTLKRQSHAEARRLTVHIDYQRRCSDVATADYGNFRDAVQRAVQSFQDELVFGKAEPVATVKHRR